MSAAPSPAASAAHLSTALIDLDRRRVNAEQIARFQLDELADAHSQIDTLGERLESVCEENREKRIALSTLRDRLGTAIELVREGRTSLAIATMHDLLALAERGRVAR